MHQNQTSLNSFIGVDVSKLHLDLFVGSTGEHHRIDNTLRSIRSWLKKQASTEAYMIFEATGGYEKTLQTALRDHPHLTPKRIHPAQVKSFARALGKRAKTDKIDAEMLARAAQWLGDDLHDTTPSADIQQLRDLLMRKTQLQETLHAEQCRAKMPHLSPLIARNLAKAIKHIQNLIVEINQDIHAHIAAQRAMKERSERLKTVRGVGEQVAATVMAFLPELGTLSRKEIAALAGLAPITRQSGSMKGRARTGGGRQPLKKALFMAALVGIRHNPVLKTFYQSLLEKQKPKMVAIIATARKLLTYLNALEKNVRNVQKLA